VAAEHDVPDEEFAQDQARLAELAVLGQKLEYALTIADEVLTATEESGSGATLRALLHRVRGYALAQQGDTEGAAEALRWSIDIARESGETYEVARTLEAIARLRGGENRGRRVPRPPRPARRRLHSRDPGLGKSGLLVDRDGRIRTAGLLLPKQAR
jgi:ATP/maltotriose-dependent transcriptional regulator MalT